MLHHKLGPHGGVLGQVLQGLMLRVCQLLSFIGKDLKSLKAFIQVFTFPKIFLEELPDPGPGLVGGW